MPKSYTPTREQRAELESLAYWIADRAWSRERGELDEHEDQRTNNTIRAIFDALDRLRVPYWAQNAVICWAGDWRRTMCEDLRDAMRARSIIL
jgi:hypothetical protein